MAGANGLDPASLAYKGDKGVVHISMSMDVEIVVLVEADKHLIGDCSPMVLLELGPLLLSRWPFVREQFTSLYKF